MGLIKNFNGLLDGKEYHGWIDIKTKKPVHIADAKKLYETYILEHSVICVAKDEDEKPYTLLQEVTIEEDLPPFSVPKDSANQYQAKQNDHVDTCTRDSDEERLVTFKRGASLILPKSLGYIRQVVRKAREGWGPERMELKNIPSHRLIPLHLIL
jgi:3-oxoacyl-ACP reductase-like protein